MNTLQWREAWSLYHRLKTIPSDQRLSVLLESCSDPEVLGQLRKIADGSDQELAETPAWSRTGTRLSHYEIEEQLGLGGMGEVYAATDTVLGRRVAVKMLSPRALANPDSVRRLMSEARASSALNHPSIVTIHEFVQEGDTLAIVMELIHGSNLREQMKAPVINDQVLEVAHQAAEALAAAHERGIIHRDIKPENIMVRRDGYVKVVDFGLAQLMEAEPRAPKLRSMAALGGTLLYMSPEQLHLKPLTPATDVYSLGLVLAELTLGEHPLTFVDPPSQVATRLPEKLRPLIARMLSEQPSDRPTARETAETFRNLKEQTSHPTVSAAGRGRRWALGALGASAIGGVTSFLIWKRLADSDQAPALSVVKPITSYPGTEFQPSISADGKSVVFVWNRRRDAYKLYAKSVASGAVRQITNGSGYDLNPAWSPDGSQIAFLRMTPQTRDILLVPSSGGVPQLLTSAKMDWPIWIEDASLMNLSPGPAWAPHGRAIVFSDQPGGPPDTLHMFSLDNRKKTQVTWPGKHVLGDHFPAFSPDGQSLAFFRMANPKGQNGIFIQSLRDGVAKKLTTDLDAILGLAWIGRDHLIFASDWKGSNRLWSISVRSGKRTPLEVGGRYVTRPSASANGQRVVYTAVIRNTNIWRFSLVNGRERGTPLIASSGRNDSAQYSPDGTQLAFVSDRSGTQEIWTCDANGENPVQLTRANGVGVGSARWSPNNQRIVYDSIQNGFSVVYLISRDGGDLGLFAGGHENFMMPTWSRDGRFIYFCASDRNEIWKKPVGGGAAIRVATHGGEMLESWNGQTLFHLRSSPGTWHGLWQRPADGGDESIVPGLRDIAASRHISVTRKGIYFLASEEPPWEVRVFDFHARQVSTVLKLERSPDFGTPSLSVSPDDKWILVAQLDQDGSDIMMLEASH